MEADVAVGDLHEPQVCAACRGGVRRTGDVADHLSPGDCQDDGATEPGGVPHELSAGHTVLAVAVGLVCRFGHGVTSTVAVMNGWMVQ